ncbi:hypothetical protein [Chitinophaga sp. HK235]|uniref:hypothetical protein n=1 Tax=Chitinophaga sp. HK235 TaxID=2952571 RepID=UPI001BA75C9B|nr:hypothetical protein [Chitinophaga sp. HK235]
MRSFIALMACIGCIAWVHSCDKRLLGVKVTRNTGGILQLPVDVPAIASNQEAPQKILATASRPAPAVHTAPSKPTIAKKRHHAVPPADSLWNGLVASKHSNFLLNNLIP